MRDWIFRSSRKVFLSNWKYRKVLPLKQCYVHQGVRWLETSKITITLVTLPRVELRHHHNRSKNDNPLHTNRRAKKECFDCYVSQRRHYSYNAYNGSHIANQIWAHPRLMTENATFGLRTIYSHDSLNRIFSRVRDKFSTKNHRWGGFRRLSREKYREKTPISYRFYADKRTFHEVLLILLLRTEVAKLYWMDSIFEPLRGTSLFLA